MPGRPLGDDGWRITGRTRIWAILADPIQHVKTPQGLNPLLRAECVDGVMVPIHVGAQDLVAMLDGLRAWRNFGGFIATVPHKSRMPALCDAVSDRARLIGAANVVRREADGRLVADMLDGEGFVAGLRAAGVNPNKHRAFLAGAGGAASAIAFALVDAGVSHLTITNRTRSKANELRGRIVAYRPDALVRVADDPAGHSLVVNATSLGLRVTDPLPFDVRSLDQGCLVAEIIMDPELTPIMSAAKARGLRTHPGMPMLASQLTLMARFLGMTE